MNICKFYSVASVNYNTVSTSSLCHKMCLSHWLTLTQGPSLLNSLPVVTLVVHCQVLEGNDGLKVGIPEKASFSMLCSWLLSRLLAVWHHAWYLIYCKLQGHYSSDATLWWKKIISVVYISTSSNNILFISVVPPLYGSTFCQFVVQMISLYISSLLHNWLHPKYAISSWSFILLRTRAAPPTETGR